LQNIDICTSQVSFLIIFTKKYNKNEY